MSNQESTVVFDEDRAASYDQRMVKVAAMRDALFLLMRLVLGELPDDARILCVGAGTGAELMELARAFPGWQFTAVEPAKAMLDVCRRGCEENGYATRCTFHEGYLDTLPDMHAFDGATCLLVSHFFMHKEERIGFLGQIAARLRVGGILVSSDLTSDMSTPEYRSMLAVWARMLEYAGFPPQDVLAFQTSHGRTAAVLPSGEVTSLIASAGFDSPTLFYQCLFIHAWYSRRV